MFLEQRKKNRMFNEADKNVRKELSNITIDISIEHYRFFFWLFGFEYDIYWIKSKKKFIFFCENFSPLKNQKNQSFFSKCKYPQCFSKQKKSVFACVKTIGGKKFLIAEKKITRWWWINNDFFFHLLFSSNFSKFTFFIIIIDIIMIISVKTRENHTHM